jgi:hypothetical protein
MTTVPATIVAMLVLSTAGALPTMALVGLRWITFSLAPLTGAVIAAMAATAFLAVGGSFMGWFVALTAVGAALCVASWTRWPDRRPWADGSGSRPPSIRGHRMAGAIGALGIVVASVWCLRDLSTPTVGFDARTFWLLRSGWLLHSHHQLLIAMRAPSLHMGQSGYPPLVSAAGAVAWSVTGNQTMRLGVVVIALLNTCALATAAFALVELGRKFTARLSLSGDRSSTGFATSLPMIAGVVAGVLLILISFGINEPFMTNGYADPMWSLAALGAVVYGLQAGGGRSEQGVVAILVIAAGMTKYEGLVTAAILIVLVAIRQLATMPADQWKRRWRRGPIAVGIAELAAVGAWPILMKILRTREPSSSRSSPDEMASRARAIYDSFGPYLHVLLLAVPIAVIGGLVLAKVRRRSHAANDWWAWAGLASGLGSVAGALIIGSQPIKPWLVATVHRVTEFPAMAGWWIVATWAVVASGAPAVADQQPTALPAATNTPEHEGPPGPGDIADPASSLVPAPATPRAPGV